MHVVTEPAILYLGTPVVVISTVNEDGSCNLAPMSSAFWASVPIPKFAHPCGNLSCELRNRRDTSNLMILVPLLNAKFANAFAARCVRTSGSGH
jgi:flavin reductase (DIM6/NTAB) family NADH-FMN oxidoreductase RutF